MDKVVELQTYQTPVVLSHIVRLDDPHVTPISDRPGQLTTAPLSKSPTPSSSVPKCTAQHHSPTVLRTKKQQKIRITASGLVYSGPTAILSHLYKARFVIDNIPYNSVEQRLQSQKTELANDIQAVNDIRAFHNTWEIKTRGDRVKLK